MSTYQLGFIGTGNMGGALAQAAAKSGAGYAPVQPHSGQGGASGRRARLRSRDESGGRRRLQIHLSRRQAADAPGAAGRAESAAFGADGPAVLVSMAAGVTIRTIRETLGLPCPVVRIMPNLPVALGKGVVLISPDDTVTEDELTALEEALKPAGLLMRMPEDKLDAGSAVSGCGRRSSICFWTRWQTAA